MGKLERLKKSRKTIHWYQQHYGFRSPFHVVLSSDFIKLCVIKNKRIDVLIYALFGEQVVIETTRCTINALPYPPSVPTESENSDTMPVDLQKRIAQTARSFSLTFQCRHQHLDADGV